MEIDQNSLFESIQGNLFTQTPSEVLINPTINI